jgi:mRNA interferase MazF
MATLKRGMIIDVDFGGSHPGTRTGNIRPCVVVTNNVYNEKVPVIQVVPITSWDSKKARIATNVELLPSTLTGLPDRAIADCLQTRPLAYRSRLVKIRGRVASSTMDAISRALKVVFELQNEQ